MRQRDNPLVVPLVAIALGTGAVYLLGRHLIDVIFGVDPALPARERERQAAQRDAIMKLIAGGGVTFLSGYAPQPIQPALRWGGIGLLGWGALSMIFPPEELPAPKEVEEREKAIEAGKKYVPGPADFRAELTTRFTVSEGKAWAHITSFHPTEELALELQLNVWHRALPIGDWTIIGTMYVPVTVPPYAKVVREFDVWAGLPHIPRYGLGRFELVIRHMAEPRGKVLQTLPDVEDWLASPW